jgi:hypothetical protein
LARFPVHDTPAVAGVHDRLQISANPRFVFSFSTLAATSTSRQVCRSDDDSSNDSP